MKPDELNRGLLWDYRWTPEETETEAFERWYVARVLTRGSAQDVRALGLPRIARHLPAVHLPRRVRAFWTWYLDERHPDPAPVRLPP